MFFFFSQITHLPFFDVGVIVSGFFTVGFFTGTREENIEQKKILNYTVKCNPVF